MLCINTEIVQNSRENLPIKMLKQWPFAVLLNKNQPLDCFELVFLSAYVMR